MPEQGTKPVNKYLPPRPKDTLGEDRASSPPFPRARGRQPAGASLGWPRPARWASSDIAPRALRHRLHDPPPGLGFGFAWSSSASVSPPVNRLDRLLCLFLILPIHLRSAGSWPRPSISAAPNARSRPFTQWQTSWLSREAWGRGGGARHHGPLCRSRRLPRHPASRRWA